MQKNDDSDGKQAVVKQQTSQQRKKNVRRLCNNLPEVVNYCRTMNPICINLDDKTPTASSATSHNQWVPELGLTTRDRNILLHPTAWLNDNIIDAAQKLIKTLCPALFGLQTVSNCQTMGFDVQTSAFVQILVFVRVVS